MFQFVWIRFQLWDKESIHSNLAGSSDSQGFHTWDPLTGLNIFPDPHVMLADLSYPLTEKLHEDKSRSMWIPCSGKRTSSWSKGGRVCDAALGCVSPCSRQPLSSREADPLQQPLRSLLPTFPTVSRDPQTSMRRNRAASWGAFLETDSSPARSHTCLSFSGLLACWAFQVPGNRLIREVRKLPETEETVKQAKNNNSHYNYIASMQSTSWR